MTKHVLALVFCAVALRADLMYAQPQAATVESEMSKAAGLFLEMLGHAKDGNDIASVIFHFYNNRVPGVDRGKLPEPVIRNLSDLVRLKPGLLPDFDGSEAEVRKYLVAPPMNFSHRTVEDRMIDEVPKAMAKVTFGSLLWQHFDAKRKEDPAEAKRLAEETIKALKDLREGRSQPRPLRTARSDR